MRLFLPFLSVFALACGAVHATKPDEVRGSKGDSDCLRFEILDTLLKDGTIHIRPDAPILELLPIGQGDIASSALVQERVDTWDVAVTLSPQAGTILSHATRRNI